MVQTHSHSKDSGIKLPEEYGVNKGINSDIKQEKQVLKSQNPANKSKPRQEKRRPQERNESPNISTSASADST